MKQRQNKSRPGGRSGKPAVKSPRSDPAVILSPRRKWLFRLFALVVVPLLLLGGLEIILRLSGFGYSTGFFEKIRVGGKDFLVNSKNFSQRFFPPQLARWPGPVMFEAKKSANTCRIFILGESAARGEPETGGRLRERRDGLEGNPASSARRGAHGHQPARHEELRLCPAFEGGAARRAVPDADGL